MDESKFLKVAKQAALEAGEKIKKYSGKRYKVKFKDGDRSDLVTQADIEAEEVIVSILSRYFPTHNIIAEENTKLNKGSEFTWAIDPVDGTISFVTGVPYFSVGIGLLKNNKPKIGVIYHISEDKLYYALDNKGTYLNGKVIHVSNKKGLDKSVLVLDFGHRARRQEKFSSYIEPLKNKIGYMFSLGGFSASLGHVANGTFDGAVASGWLWDFVAGTVIIREAGGKVTDFDGNEPDWTKERLSIVASNGLIHDQILEALKR